MREHIRSCFEETDCFLMPHPGLKVAQNPKFDGRVADIEVDFINQLAVLIPSILKSKYLRVKKIHGSPVTCSGLYQYFNSYMKIYESDELPEPKTMLNATAEANNLQAVNVSRSLYQNQMDKICGADQPYKPTDQVAWQHEYHHAESITLFKRTQKMGGDLFSAPYLEQLETDLNAMYEAYRKNNDSKHIFGKYKAPATFLVFAVLLYFVSTFLNLLGATSYANFFWFLTGLVLLTMATYIYISAAGTFTEAQQLLDDLSNVVRAMHWTSHVAIASFWWRNTAITALSSRYGSGRVC